MGPRGMIRPGGRPSAECFDEEDEIEKIVGKGSRQRGRAKLEYFVHTLPARRSSKQVEIGFGRRRSVWASC